LSGKREVIDGKHLMSVAEIFNFVREAEETTRKRGQKKNQNRRKRTKKPWNSKNIDFSEESEATEDESVEILDCIEVEVKSS
jgi:hypothetical protein